MSASAFWTTSNPGSTSYTPWPRNISWKRNRWFFKRKRKGWRGWGWGRRRGGGGGEVRKSCSDDFSQIFVLISMLSNFYSSLMLRQNELECLSREPLLKGKARFGWPPCTNSFRSAGFILKILLTFFTKQAALVRRSTVLSLSLLSVVPVLSLASFFPGWSNICKQGQPNAGVKALTWPSNIKPVWKTCKVQTNQSTML